MSKRLEVTRQIDASPMRLYEMISDLPRMGEWSPENRGGQWVKGATGPAVGARFKGANKLGRISWNTHATVVTAEPEREFAFDVTAAGVPVARWGYRFVPVGDATEVTEYWEDHRPPLIGAIGGLILGVRDRPAHNRAGMEATLATLAEAAER
jgi:hypothetical protein